MNHSTRKFAGALIAILGFAFGANVASASVLTTLSPDSKCIAFNQTELSEYNEVYGYDQNGSEVGGFETSTVFPTGYLGFASGYQSDCADLVDFPDVGMYLAGGLGMLDLDPVPTSLTVKIRENGEIPEIILGTWYVTPSGFSLTPPTPPDPPTFHFSVISSTSTTEFKSSLIAGVANTGENLWVIVAIVIGIFVAFWVVLEVMALFPEESEAEIKRKQRVQDKINEFELELDRQNMRTLAELEAFDNKK